MRFTRKATQPANLDESIAAARDAVEAATRALGNAALAALEAPDDAAARQRKEVAAQALVAAQADLAALSAAAPVANSREYQRAQKAQADALAAKRAIVASQCAIREKAAIDLEAAGKAAAKAYKALEEANAAIHATGLVRDAEGALLPLNALQSAFRLGFARVTGFRWAAQGWPWQMEDIPTLTAKITAANAHLLTSVKP